MDPDPVSARVSVVGPPGSGKSTLARALQARCGLVHVELDALHHGPDWTPTPRDQLRDAVTARLDAIEATGRGWVVDGNYRSLVGDLVWARCTIIAWLDLPRRVVFPALAWRTLRRGLTRTELWNGNTERPFQLLDPRPEHNVLAWSISHFAKYRADYSTAWRLPPGPEVDVVRLADRAAVGRWLDVMERSLSPAVHPSTEAP